MITSSARSGGVEGRSVGPEILRACTLSLCLSHTGMDLEMDSREIVAETRICYCSRILKETDEIGRDGSLLLKARRGEG